MSRFNPANRPSQPFNPSIITGAQSRIPNRTIIPSKTVDESVIGKLFLLCIEGKVSAIKDFILTNGKKISDIKTEKGEKRFLIKVDGSVLTQNTPYSFNYGPGEPVDCLSSLYINVSCCTRSCVKLCKVV